MGVQLSTDEKETGLTLVCRFDKALPAVFQLGDIVEVQVSFVALPQRDNKAKLSLILRGISLLEKEFTQVRQTHYPEVVLTID